MLSIADQLAISEFAVDANRLYYLDQIWTQRLADPAPLTPNEVEVISRIARDIDTLLERLPIHLDAVGKCVPDTHDGAAALARLSTDERFGDYFQALDSLVPGTSFTFSPDRVHTQLADLRANLATERRDRALKLAAIRAENRSAGDSGNEFMCNLGGALFAGGLLLLGNPLTAATGGAGVITGMIVSITYRCLVP